MLVYIAADVYLYTVKEKKESICRIRHFFLPHFFIEKKRLRLVSNVPQFGLSQKRVFGFRPGWATETYPQS